MNTDMKKNLKTPQKNMNKNRSKSGLYTQSHAKLKYSKHIND